MDSRHEAGLLKLNCDKAMHILKWKATLDFEETTYWTSDWYRTFYEEGPEVAAKLTRNQIKEYMELAYDRNSFNLN